MITGDGKKTVGGGRGQCSSTEASWASAFLPFPILCPLPVSSSSHTPPPPPTSLSITQHAEHPLASLPIPLSCVPSFQSIAPCPTRRHRHCRPYLKFGRFPLTLSPHPPPPPPPPSWYVQTPPSPSTTPFPHPPPYHQPNCELFGFRDLFHHTHHPPPLLPTTPPCPISGSPRPPGTPLLHAQQGTLFLATQ